MSGDASAATTEPLATRRVDLPRRVLGRFTRNRRRSIGGMWHHDKEAVTLLLFPDSADDCKALVTLDCDAAEALADDLRQLAKWSREYAAMRAENGSTPTGPDDDR